MMVQMKMREISIMLEAIKVALQVLGLNYLDNCFTSYLFLGYRSFIHSLIHSRCTKNSRVVELHAGRNKIIIY